MRDVFIAGGTGYMGQRLVRRLVAAGLTVDALARPGSEDRVARGARVVPGDALDHRTYAVRRGATFVHLVGTPHPSPSKARQFREVDLPGLRESVEAARSAHCEHFIFVSVAQPALVMKAYIEVRQECEAAIRSAGLNATILRPWYVLGPGHWWPLALKPLYWVGEQLAATREQSLRLGLVRLEQMVAALDWAVANPAGGVRVLDVPAIRRCAELM